MVEGRLKKVDVSYSKDTCHTYMIIRGNTDGLAEEEMMLSNQDSRVLLPFHIRQLDGRKDYYYDITGKTDFRSFIEKRQADRQMIKSVIRFLEDAYRVADEFLLDIDRMVMDTACIYMDVDEKQMAAAYLPGWKGDFMDAAKQLTAFLLEHTNHTDQESVLLVYDFYQMVRREDFAPRLLERLTERDLKVNQSEIPEIQEMPDRSAINMDWDTGGDFDAGKNESADYWRPQQEEEVKEDEEAGRSRGFKWLYAGLAGMGILVILLYITGVMARGLILLGVTFSDGQMTAGILAGLFLTMLLLKVLRRQKAIPAKNDSEGEIWEDFSFDQGGVYSFIDETGVEDSRTNEKDTVLLSDRAPTIRLISMNKNIAPDMVLTSFPCVVGSSRTKAQFVIQVIGISRKHGLFEVEHGDVYLTDLNSTNGIRVNGEQLKPEQRRKLLVEDVIEFADVRYMFCGKGKAADESRYR